MAEEQTEFCFESAPGGLDKEAARRERRQKYYAEYRHKNREQIRQRDRDYYKGNREKKLAATAAAAKKTPDKAKARRRRWRVANKEQDRAAARGRYAADPQKAQERQKRWRAANPEKRREVDQRSYKKNYPIRRENPQYRLAMNLRGRLRVAVKRCGTVKHARTFALVGCDLIALRVHLQSRFKPGMTWENYGRRWHVDHIVPVSKWDLFNPKQQLLCFHYSNLQPLWGADNQSKSNKFKGSHQLPLLMD